ncbi:MAG: DNA polymerase sliding clamp [Candidatus Poseidoniales archaeon]|nr:DNA polymerase sliding clamp [Candidatus Poseidoniales archaeon]RJV00493.1 MAG: DNA polymerase sliding clamp [Candidatus Poseidoniales archaeon]
MLNVTARQELMRTIVETLGVVVEEARLDFGEDGLSVRVVDPSHVAMIKMDVDSAAFDTWELDDTKLGLEMRPLKEIMSQGQGTDMVELSYDDNTGQASIKIGRIDMNMRPLDNSTLNPPNLPNLDLPCGVTIAGAELAQAIRASKLVGDLINMSLTESEFSVNVKGPNREVNANFSKDELHAIDCDSAARSQYSLTYLIPLAKVFQGIEHVNLRFGENFPLMITFDFADGAGHVEYFLAPRVEGDI